MKIVCYIFHEGNLKSFKVDNLPARVSKPKIMEVKIKNGAEMIDATIEMVDGVMVVSPKVEKFEPKDGDTYFRTDFNGCIFICYEGKYRYDTNRYIKGYVEKGWCFKTKEECQEFCDRLNDAINSVKL